MKCPFCSTDDDRVVDSRTNQAATEIRRRRECIGCGKRFTTYEVVADTLPWVIKRNGEREGYSRTKVLSGIRKACEKRKVPAAAVESLLDDLERWLRECEEREIESRRIGDFVRDRLRRLDPVAWLRFSSVYLQFDRLDDFYRALESFNKGRKQ